MGKRRSLPKFLLAIVGAGVIALVFIFSLGGGGKDDAVTFAKFPGPPSMGDPDAPITVIEYADFQCPYCGIFARDVFPELVDEFVSTGQVRFEWRNFPIFGAFSDLSARGATCAHEQGAFWEYHDALYAVVDSLSAGSKNVDTLVEIASSINLDTEEFRACVVEERYNDQVGADYREGRELGIVGTPAFTINGMMMMGAQPIESWRLIFDAVASEGGE